MNDTPKMDVLGGKGLPPTETKTSDFNSTDAGGYIGISHKFAALNRLITRDLNNVKSTNVFYLYNKSQIIDFLKDPNKYEKELRAAINYIYGASSHFRRLIQYFSSLTDLAFVVSPFKIDPKSANVKSVGRNYRKILNVMSSMNVKTQFPKIISTCLREDVFYGTMWVTNDNITIQQLPPDRCKISVIEGNVPNVSFDFQYFDTNGDLLDYYPDEFRAKYELYRERDKKGRQGSKVMRWQELDSPTSFAVKCTNEILDYPLPPFAGILREIYDIEDYKQMKLSKTALENYAMVVMSLGVDKDGNWQMDLQKAKEFWRNLDDVLPEEIGSVLTPMPLNKISFEKSNTGDTDTIAEAEQNLYTAAGVSSLLFNNSKASANALLLSIKADQALTFGIVQSIEDVVNRYIQSLSYGKNFKVTFLDVSPFNRKEASDAYLKAAQYGLPTLSMYAAAQGLGQAEFDAMSFLENTVLGLTEMFEPLKSSATRSAADAEESEGGAPQKSIDELTDSGEQSREDGDDW